MKYTALAAIAAIAVSGPVQAFSILGLAENGEVYSIDTATGTASFVRQVQDLAGQDQNSPNGLGSIGSINGNLFYTNFGNNVQNTLYRDNDFLTNIPAGGFSIAAADVSGDNYVYVDRNFAVQSVGNIFGDPGTQTVSQLGDLGGGDTLGDLAIRGKTAYLSFGDDFGTFDLTNPNSFTFQNTSADRRYAGLAFDASGGLFGFTVGTTNDLYSINTSTGVGTFVATISGLSEEGLRLTDAATVIPLPASVLFLLSAMAGFGGLSVLRKARAA